MKRVVAIHDLSAFGKASLTIVIPTLSAMGFQVCPLPTALLSTHTGFKNFTFLDLTAEMKKIIAHWKSLGLIFDAIYSGFLGSPEQIEIISGFIDGFRKNRPLVLVDPVMGDDGVLYPTMNQEMVGKMRELVKKADIVTPNLTEAALLSGKKYKKNVSRKELAVWMRKISDSGPKYVVVTSAPDNDDYGSVLAFDREADVRFGCGYRRLPSHFSGAGDVFASMLLGNMLLGFDLLHSLNQAVNFVSLALNVTFIESDSEILLEKVLADYFVRRP